MKEPLKQSLFHHGTLKSPFQLLHFKENSRGLFSFEELLCTHKFPQTLIQTENMEDDAFFFYLCHVALEALCIHCSELNWQQKLRNSCIRLILQSREGENR